MHFSYLVVLSKLTDTSLFIRIEKKKELLRVCKEEQGSQLMNQAETLWKNFRSETSNFEEIRLSHILSKSIIYNCVQSHRRSKKKVFKRNMMIWHAFI